ncbi:MAG: sigma-70 family RNA polymerase sigma factor [Chloroflexi bacterium]|nr:MAG: sigma-70 family RNA polymerase sigma factor [Chloroflexota bacterium]
MRTARPRTSGSRRRSPATSPSRCSSAWSRSPPPSQGSSRSSGRVNRTDRQYSLVPASYSLEGQQMKMRHVDSPGGAPSTANDTWRTWLMTGVRRNGVDRRRVRGAHLGIKKMLVEGMHVRSDKPYTWKDFSDAMVRQSVGEAMRELPYRDSQLIKLAYFGGMSNREIADHMWMAEGTVERRLRRALDTISRYIERPKHDHDRRPTGAIADDPRDRAIGGAADGRRACRAGARAFNSGAKRYAAGPPADGAGATGQKGDPLGAVAGVDHDPVDDIDLVIAARHEGGEHGVVAHRIHAEVAPVGGCRVNDQRGRMRPQVGVEERPYVGRCVPVVRRKR